MFKSSQPPSKTVALEMNPCLGVKTGVGVYTYELIKALAKKRGDFRLIAQYYTGFPYARRERDTAFSLEIDTCPYFAYGVYRRIWTYTPFHYDFLFRKKANIYHFFNFIVPPHVSGKVITTIHDIAYELYPETMLKSRHRRLKKDIQYSIERADIIVSVSQFTKKMLVEHLKVPEKKIRVVSPGVYYENFAKIISPQIKTEVKKRYNLPQKYILFMGTLEPRKNIEIILKAYKIFLEKNHELSREIKLVIAGKKGWLYESIFQLANNLGISSYVVFTGYVHDDDKTAIYREASLFLFPSLYEGFGIPVIEAMSAGIPVITSNNSSLPEVSGNAAVLVDCMDFEHIAVEMRHILCDEVYAKKLTDAGIKQARKFSWEKSADKIIDIYKELE